ncbi:lysyl-tRNA synthetase [Pyronema domesticum]|uniref:Lysyl-tRNA synthetase n=1 Tax=Pyronema omphalodes (strain CBS 100304) TaxID=1076935 RepID=U4L8L8_PYROM|nr:lysyl-tRNA synthetase [Pyronema domesticum]CCX13177.1 Similar to Lysine--tRNA ligase, mitochondrial; acc. no. O74858 [Pyronema omphalodes CBS 100304]
MFLRRTTRPSSLTFAVRRFNHTQTPQTLPVITRVKAPIVAKRPPQDGSTRRDAFLSAKYGELYPRLEDDTSKIFIRHKNFHATYSSKIQSQDRDLRTTVTIRGRIRKCRDLSPKLIFYDIIQDGIKVQAVFSHVAVGGSEEDFYVFNTALRNGDIIEVTGNPGRTKTGELSVYAVQLPKLLSPCYHQVPDALANPEKIKQHRHLDLLVNEKSSQTLRLRSMILNQIRQTLSLQDFTEVQTPILSASAGGAIANPFLTAASAVHKPLALRIAPELWLKRLLVGGLDRVYEMGPVFRNEGIDNTHNPEFTTAEAYISFGNLEDVCRLTETVLRDVAKLCGPLKGRGNKFHELEPLDNDIQDAFLYPPYNRIEFIPTLEAKLGEPLPDLDAEDTEIKLRELCERHKIYVDKSANSAKILDKMAEKYLEPMCYLPTFITHHPQVMSPLAKGSVRNGRKVSERVELFVRHMELVNAYEEENSPHEQRRKFQLQAKDEGREMEEGEGTDEDYCQTLEWGLPPTAGWGIGVDRVVMLMAGQDRIHDVIAFGGLRGAANQGGSKEKKIEEKKKKKLEKMKKGLAFLEAKRAEEAGEKMEMTTEEKVEEVSKEKAEQAEKKMAEFF